MKTRRHERTGIHENMIKYENKDEPRLEKTEERKENEIKRTQTKETEDQRAKTHENE